VVVVFCIEATFNALDGIISATSGYCGGDTLDSNYESICTGKTGHAEVVRVIFDESIITYKDLLDIFLLYTTPHS
jgi:peptide-methionine (S)-S-oxide reductase